MERGGGALRESPFWNGWTGCGLLPRHSPFADFAETPCHCAEHARLSRMDRRPLARAMTNLRPLGRIPGVERPLALAFVERWPADLPSGQSRLVQLGPSVLKIVHRWHREHRV